MNRVVQNTSREQRFQSPPIHDVTRTVKEFMDVELQSGVLEDAHRPVLVEFYQHIDIAFRTGFALRHGTEHCGVGHSQASQISLVGAESFQHVLEIQSHSPPLYQTIAVLAGCCEGPGASLGGEIQPAARRVKPTRRALESLSSPPGGG